MSIKWIKETFCQKKKKNYDTSPSLLFHSCSISPRLNTWLTLTLVSDKRALMLFFPITVFPNLVIHNTDMSTSTLLVIKQCK